jgi:serine/threonine protein kinase
LIFRCCGESPEPKFFGVPENIWGSDSPPCDGTFEIRIIDISDNEVRKRELDQLERVAALANYIKRDYRLCSIVKLPEKIMTHGSEIIYIDKKPPGLTLSSIIYQCRTQPTDLDLYRSLRSIFAKIGEALAYVHEVGGLMDAELTSRLVHKNLTPDNILYFPVITAPVVFLNNWRFSVNNRASVLIDLVSVISNCQELLDGLEEDPSPNNFLDNFVESYIDFLPVYTERKLLLKSFFRDIMAVRPEFFKQKRLSETEEYLEKAGADGEKSPPEKIQIEGSDKFAEYNKIIVKRQLGIMDMYIETINLHKKSGAHSLLEVLETVKTRNSPPLRHPPRAPALCCSSDHFMPPSLLSALFTDGSSSKSSAKRGRPPISKQKAENSSSSGGSNSGSSSDCCSKDDT